MSRAEIAGESYIEFNFNIYLIIPIAAGIQFTNFFNYISIFS